MLSWLEGLPISEWVATSDWGYPLLLSIHSMGMAAVVGILLILDIRVLGYARAIPISGLERLVPVAWVGFLINLASGVLLFMSAATRLITNWPFLSKMACIVAGGLVSWALWQALRRDGWPEFEADSGGQATLVAGSRTKRLAMLSITIWLGAILFGRLIAYVMDAALLKGGL